MSHFGLVLVLQSQRWLHLLFFVTKGTFVILYLFLIQSYWYSLFIFTHPILSPSCIAKYRVLHFFFPKAKINYQNLTSIFFLNNHLDRLILNFERFDPPKSLNFKFWAVGLIRTSNLIQTWSSEPSWHDKTCCLIATSYKSLKFKIWANGPSLICSIFFKCWLIYFLYWFLFLPNTIFSFPTKFVSST